MTRLSHLVVGLLASTVIAVDLNFFPLVERQSTPATCTYSFQARRGYVCGVEGRAINPSPIGGPVTAATLAICQNSCLKDQPACVSFSYNTATKSCQLYNKKILSSQFRKDSTTNNIFYNRHCFVKSCTCPSQSQTVCGKNCYDLSSDNNHCGTCSTKCSSSQTCFLSTCSCGDSDDCGNGVCASGHDNNNCGQCGNVCPADSQCRGFCQCDDSTKTACSTGCTNTSTDNNNCGGCANHGGEVCTGTQQCIGGTCQNPDK